MSRHVTSFFLTLLIGSSGFGCSSEVTTVSGDSDEPNLFCGGTVCDVSGLYNRIDWTFVSFDGTDISSADGILPGDEVDLQLEGQIIDAAAGLLTIDSCPPTTGCTPMRSTLTLHVRDGDTSENPDVPLEHGIAVGTLVRIHLQQAAMIHPDAPAADPALHVTVLNLPAWDGAPNPVEASNRLWLTVSEGSVIGGPNELTGATDPITVERATECVDSSTGLTGYRLNFTLPDYPRRVLSLLGDEHGELSIPDGDHMGDYQVHNVRSWTSSEPPGGTGYTIVRSPPAP